MRSGMNFRATNEPRNPSANLAELIEKGTGHSDTHIWLVWPKASLAWPKGAQNPGSTETSSTGTSSTPRYSVPRSLSCLPPRASCRYTALLHRTTRSSSLFLLLLLNLLHTHSARSGSRARVGQPAPRDTS